MEKIKLSPKPHFLPQLQIVWCDNDSMGLTQQMWLQPANPNHRLLAARRGRLEPQEQQGSVKQSLYEYLEANTQVSWSYMKGTDIARESVTTV